jgi:methylenetetrahydrofolate reductase (NADPH)
MRIIDVLNQDKINISCELFPPKQGAELQNALDIVKEIALVKPSYMSVTYGAGGTSVGHTVAIAKGVQDNGIPALAHLTCVKSDEANILAVLQQLKDNGIHNVLALRGDLPDGTHDGHFEHASDLAKFVKANGDFCVGGAAYPEGHPEAGTLDKDIENTKYKIDAGVDFLVTQMFFDNTILYNYMFRLLSAGIHVPVVPGIMPITNAKQVERAIKLSGSFMPQRFKSLVDKFGSDPDAMKQAGIAYATDQIIDLYANGLTNIHVYSMNKPDVAEKIQSNLSDIIGK